MITIAPLLPEQALAAKRVIVTVARPYFGADKSVEEFAAILDEEHELDDVDHYQDVYGGERGIFLVVMDDDRIAGTGALKPFDQQTAELKRLWLLEEYHGRGLGYRLVMRLFDFARQAGYERIVLQTDIKQLRAIAFYKRIGFVEIPAYNTDPYEEDISLELRFAA